MQSTWDHYSVKVNFLNSTIKALPVTMFPFFWFPTLVFYKISLASLHKCPLQKWSARVGGNYLSLYNDINVKQ